MTSTQDTIIAALVAIVDHANGNPAALERLYLPDVREALAELLWASGDRHLAAKVLTETD